MTADRATRRRRNLAVVAASVGTMALATPPALAQQPAPAGADADPDDLAADAALVAQAALARGDERIIRSDTHTPDDDRILALGVDGELAGTIGTAESDARTGVDDAHRATVVDELPEHGLRLAAVVEERPADDEVSFPLVVASGVTVEILASGQVLFTRDDDVVGVIDEPWAVDATGAPVETAYELRAGELVQRLALDDPAIVYPVVADPTYWAIPSSTPVATDKKAVQYTHGSYRPGTDFTQRRGYYPRWGSNQGATRVVRQSGECSWYPDTGPYWDFQIPCKSHDFCWDLIRVYKANGNYGKVTKDDCDSDFLAAMRSHCNQRGAWTRGLCNAEATLVYTAVRPFNP